MTPALPGALRAALERHDSLVVAVSGGVDSMTLAHAAQRLMPGRVAMFHALSPAVPAEATRRVRNHAGRHGWRLLSSGSGEFADRRYRENPLERCYFCKSNLYDRIRGVIEGPIASGANTDDLGDYRPGLKAATERGIFHPFVEAGIDKAAIRALAAGFGLGDLAALPAQPCLASRIETGIAIAADDLAFVETTETALRPLLPPGTDLRCRITRQGIVIEAGAGNDEAILVARAESLCRQAGRRFAGLRPYARGSAFIGKPSVLAHG